MHEPRVLTAIEPQKFDELDGYAAIPNGMTLVYYHVLQGLRTALVKGWFAAQEYISSGMTTLGNPEKKPSRPTANQQFAITFRARRPFGSGRQDQPCPRRRLPSLFSPSYRWLPGARGRTGACVSEPSSTHRNSASSSSKRRFNSARSAFSFCNSSSTAAILDPPATGAASSVSTAGSPASRWA